MKVLSYTSVMERRVHVMYQNKISGQSLMHAVDMEEFFHDMIFCEANNYLFFLPHVV